MKRQLLGIDIGTSACKVAVFDEDGKVLAQANRSYKVYYPQSGWAEQDPEEWWEAICGAIREALSEEEVRAEEISGIGVDGQSWSAIPVDENGNVVDASDEDKEAAITKILDELKDKGMSDEDLKKMKDTLSDLAYSKATGDEAPDSEMKKGEAEDDDEELDEKMKDPTFKSGFEAGVRYGEKREKDDPKRIDRDHEREGEERYLHEVEDALKSCGLDDAPDEVKDAFKEGYKFTAKEAEDDGEEVEETEEKVEEKVRASDSLKALKSALIDEMTAIEEVKPVVGAIRLGAYDSAGQVYMAALKKLGISGVSASQARIAYRAYIAGRQGSTKSTARDSAPKESRTALTQILEKVN